MSELRSLPNVGKVLEEHLQGIGIDTPEQLIAAGCENVFIRIRLSRDPGACLHMLYGIEGAIEGIPYTMLSNETKNRLKKFYNAL